MDASDAKVRLMEYCNG